ncbi:MAG: AzlD domain-containing protein [Beijerinckiaceae bacterium]|jgi:hypothetical protein
MIEMLAPYALMLIVAAVPTGIWRAGAVVLSRSISSQSLVFEWVRFVATALLAGVVAKLLANPSGALALAPDWGRLGAVVAAFAAFMAFRRSVFAGVLTGETILILSVYVTQN